MSGERKVVWSEGMFLRPQHFQQQERYLESFVQRRIAYADELCWGFHSLEFDEDAFSLGSVVLKSTRGVMPDGTPFSIPGDCPGGLSLDVPAEARDALVCLALPTPRSGLNSVIFEEDRRSAARWISTAEEVRDVNAIGSVPAEVQLGELRLRLFLQQDVPAGWRSLGVVRVRERQANQRLILDGGYVPPVLSCKGSVVLSGYLRELAGLLGQRADALVERMSGGGRGGVSDVADFLLLKLVNHWLPVLQHLEHRQVVHPERLYSELLALVGELAVFSSHRRAKVYPPYQHDDLQATFAPVMIDLRQALTVVMNQAAIRIDLEERKYGIRMAMVPDRQLLRTASFVLAAQSNLSPEQLQSQFPTQVKIGPVEKIRDLVNLHLPGVKLKPLPVAPRELPYHAGYQYFELDSHHELWHEMDRSAGVAIHIAGDFPQLELECWAIRR
ncbi:type VI secretion system baseplate subunit TssK [Thauera sp. SDU_THAU2]|uniref:type VI secretion system baseplate subunit TssK n=1 Tax=Thauera sp. SDU_THAU2 TaxID=3136633 RepID=UPI00311F6ECC